MATHAKSAARRASSSPLVLNISRSGRRPGSMMTVVETVPSPLRIGLDLIAIDEGAPLDLDLRLESVSEGVLVSGTMSAPTAGECARCLMPVTGRVEIDLTELFAYPSSATDETTDADEVGRVVDDTVNLEQPIIDAVGLALPFVPLCGPDCVGLCCRTAACRWPLPNRATSTTRSTLGGPSSQACSMMTNVTDRASLIKALGIDLPDELLTMALTHRSYSYENGGLPTNERLEFLGDAVLGLTITEELYHRHPDRSEGDLAKLGPASSTPRRSPTSVVTCQTTGSARTCCWARARRTPVARARPASWPMASNPCSAQSIWSMASRACAR